ncbi:MAG: hypothetical protein U0168_22420 [Nannocystaceae bacterium]
MRGLEAGRADRVEQIALQAAADRLIEHYRLIGHARADRSAGSRAARGHHCARPRVVRPAARASAAQLDPGTLFPGRREATAGEIVTRVQNTYTRGVGVEYWQINDVEQRNWLRDRMESVENQVVPSPRISCTCCDR